MHRLLPALLLFLLLAPTAASAASWHSFADKSLGFTVRYPRSWQLTRSATGMPSGTQVRLSRVHQSRVLSIVVSVLGIKAKKPARKALSQYLQYERRIGDVYVTQVRWSPTSLGHKAGFAGISRPPTEGGVGLTQGIYVVPWHSRIYALTMTAYGRPVPTRMSQFPSIYRQILATWRFL